MIPVRCNLCESTKSSYCVFSRNISYPFLCWAPIRYEEAGEEAGERSIHLPFLLSFHLPLQHAVWMERREQPSITAYICGLPLVILVMTILTPSEPKRSYCPVILHRDILKRNSQPEQFTVWNDRKQRAKKHYNFLKKQEKQGLDFWRYFNVYTLKYWWDKYTQEDKIQSHNLSDYYKLIVIILRNITSNLKKLLD